MITKAFESIKEFIEVHQDKLRHPPVAKTPLFSDYVTYCNEHGYEHHTNLVQFCRVINATYRH